MTHPLIEFQSFLSVVIRIVNTRIVRVFTAIFCQMVRLTSSPCAIAIGFGFVPESFDAYPRKRHAFPELIAEDEDPPCRDLHGVRQNMGQAVGSIHNHEGYLCKRWAWSEYGA